MYQIARGIQQRIVRFHVGITTLNAFETLSLNPNSPLDIQVIVIATHIPQPPQFPLPSTRRSQPVKSRKFVSKLKVSSMNVNSASENLRRIASTS